MSRRSCNKIAVIGNGGGGKTTLSRRLHEVYQLPLTHVDSIQYIAGMKTRDTNETTNILNQIAETEKWIIDGFGTLEAMQKRFLAADRIVFVDFPLWRHYWWCTKRQIKSVYKGRAELPKGCNEASFSHTLTLYKTLSRVHKEIRPRLVDIFLHEEIRG